MDKVKIDEGSKKNLVFIGKWLGFWGTWAVLDVCFNIQVVDTIIDTPAFYCAFIWVAFTLLTATFEARYYNYTSMVDVKFDAHPLLTCMRLSVLIPLLIIAGWQSGLCYVFIFPFFHDGMYYLRRNKLNRANYPKKWFAQSVTSTAKLTKFFTPIVRTVFAILGITGLILIYIYK